MLGSQETSHGLTRQDLGADTLLSGTTLSRALLLGI